MKRFSKPPSRVILHCSATADYPKGHKAFDLIGAEDIRHWHTDGRKKAGKEPFADIAYHFVIRRTGLLEPGRSLQFQGAHAGPENHDSIGVCLVGTREFTEEQVYSLLDLAEEIEFRYGIGAEQWFGHREFKNKECPGIPSDVLRALMRLAL